MQYVDYAATREFLIPLDANERGPPSTISPIIHLLHSSLSKARDDGTLTWVEEAEDLARAGGKEVVVWEQGVKAEGNWEGLRGVAVVVAKEAGVKGEVKGEREEGEKEAEVKEAGVKVAREAEVKGEEGEREAGERGEEREAGVKGEEREAGVKGEREAVNCGDERQGGGWRCYSNIRTGWSQGIISMEICLGKATSHVSGFIRRTTITEQRSKLSSQEIQETGVGDTSTGGLRQ